MRRRFRLSVSLALLLTAPAAAREAAPKPDLNANAALKYWRAFANLGRLTDEQQKKYFSPATAPLDDDTKKLVASSEPMLRELHRGAKIPQCAWAISMEDGFEALLPHLPAARQLAAMACLRARVHFEAGRMKEGVDDILAALTLGRHASRDGTLIAVLVGIAVEAMAADVFAAYLPKLEPALARDAVARYGSLPPMGTVAEAMALSEERAGLDWFVAKIVEAKDRQEVEALLKRHVDSPEKRNAVLAVAGDRDAVRRHGEATRVLFHDLAKKLRLPPDEFDRVFEAAQAQIDKNPIANVVAPKLNKTRRAEARLEAIQALVKAATAVRLEGPDAVQKHRDPFGDGPFGYTPFDGGFELRSKLLHLDKPIVLTAGKR